MKFEALLSIVGAEPVFETGLLLANNSRRSDIERQLSRWVAARRLIKLRRGLYAIAPPYRKVEPHPFLIANRLVSGSYVSCQSAAAWHGIIPEAVPTVTSVVAGRPIRFEMPLGTFVFRHVKPSLIFGYSTEEISPGQSVYVATPEKALLDWIHLEPRADSLAYLRELRLEHTERLDRVRLNRYAQRAKSPKLARAAAEIERLVAEEQSEYEVL